MLPLTRIWLPLLTGAVGSFACGAGSEPMAEPVDASPAADVGAAAILVTARIPIPLGTRVQEFSFSARGNAAPGSIDGRRLVVDVRDASHPELAQNEACPSSHPLDGCATVDYGAFGTTHDNRITVAGSDGPLAMHLYVDRTIQATAEPLPPSE